MDAASGESATRTTSAAVIPPSIRLARTFPQWPGALFKIVVAFLRARRNIGGAYEKADVSDPRRGRRSLRTREGATDGHRRRARKTASPGEEPRGRLDTG